MPDLVAEVARLPALVQRIIDSELLEEAQGAALLSEAEAASGHYRAGSAAEGRLCVERLCLFAEALIRTGALPASRGEPLVRAAAGILRPETDGQA